MSEENDNGMVSQENNELQFMNTSIPYNTNLENSLLPVHENKERKRLRFTISSKLVLSFGFVLVIIVVLSSISYINLITLQESSVNENNSYQVIAKLEKVVSLLKDTETGQRGFIITGNEDYLESYKNTSDDIRGILKDLKESSLDNKDIKDNIDELEELIDEKFNELENTIIRRKESGFKAVSETANFNEGKIIMDNIRDKTDELIGHEKEILGIQINESKRSVTRTKLTIFLGTTLSILFSVCVIFFITRFIKRSLQIVIKRIREIAMAGGNLTKGIDIRSNDEFGDLAYSFNLMLSTLGALIGRTRFAGLEVISASSQILRSSQEQATSATEQAAQITEVTASVNELAASAKQVSQSATEVSKVSNEAVKTAEVGAKSVVNSVISMVKINDSGLDLAKKIDSLGKKSQKISEILDLLDDIAEQTNLLALNAAIEAAKAGEVGKGFSVVADEIRKLADSSRKASKDISRIIVEIQTDTQDTVREMEKNSVIIEDGNRLAGIAGTAITEITGAMEEAARSVKQIAIASQQETLGANQISQTMTQLSSVVSQGVVSTEQSISSAKNLVAMAEQLKASIAQFKIREIRKKD